MGYLVCMALMGLSIAFGLQPAELVGTWDVVTESEVEEGMRMWGHERVVYGKGGEFSSSGGGGAVFEEEMIRIFTLSGEEKGAWELAEGKLRLKTRTTTVEFFSSLLEEMSRADAVEALKESLKETDVYTVVSSSKDKIVIKDVEDGMESIMTRPVEEPEAKRGADDPTARRDVKKKDPLGDRYRRFSMHLLEADGFTPAKWLPTISMRKGLGGKLRNKEEILNRILCNYIAVSWVVMSEDVIPSKRLLALVDQAGLKDSLTEGEKKIIGTERGKAADEFGGSVGWKMENMMALAWVLGAESSPDIDQDMVGEDAILLLWKFLAPVWNGKAEFLKELQLRELSAVLQTEDLFYCAHNAVRSAQNGSPKSVPPKFHPIKHGGIIHEKRHALTWVLSPGVDWEGTDLST